ncbi:hypothetical protein V6N12_011168 [Hibiscus sabdariffa]|uniref:Chitin-binding type-1 domain-containing protein n=1 Tax=Hibiscus sabdariffa TaxID=183260 RepID=A0ABR2EM80_9ROSI
MKIWVLLLSSLLLSYVLVGTAEQCGSQAGDALCPGGFCCSKYGWCGTTGDYCLVENGCQNNCAGDDSGDDGGNNQDGGALGEFITKEMF